MALGLDTMKNASDDIRATINYHIFNTQGKMGPPSNLKRLQSHPEPHNTKPVKQNSSYSVAIQYQTPHKHKQKNSQNNKRTPKNTPNQNQIKKIKKIGGPHPLNLSTPATPSRRQRA